DLGDTSYSIGIWVGSTTSPNTNSEALKQVKQMKTAKGVDNLVITRCPWCGCEIGKVTVKGSGGKSRETVPLGFRR
ncbi:hypothetical protein JQK62_26435, partial [Leptospira santarosai]|nr:hypothetical protein [Leptospira santarosai]